MIESYVDRSQILTRQQCPRKWYWEYGIPNESGAAGVVPTRLNMDLLLGLTYHVGTEGLLSGVSVEESIGRALEGNGNDWPGMWTLLKSKGLIISSSEDAYYVAHEQAALAEALLRGYALFALPQLKERFEIVEVERDGFEYFTIPELPDFKIRFGYRADALLMEKESNDLYVLSHKTTKSWNKKKEDTGHRDMQGLSEVAAIEERLKGWQNAMEMLPSSYNEAFHWDIPTWFIQRDKTGASPLITGVKMEYALKGDRREWPKGSGKYFYSNPLIRPWKKDSNYQPKRRRAPSVVSANLSLPYAVDWDFKDELGAGHTLGGGWKLINVWEDIGVKNWIEILAENPIQGYGPMEAIAKQFILPADFYRNEQKIQAWKRQTIFAEKRKYEALQKVYSAATPEAYLSALDEGFEPRAEGCDYPVKCVYQDICYGPDSYLFNPLGSGIYEPRSPNHSGELVQIDKISQS